MVEKNNVDTDSAYAKIVLGSDRIAIVERGLSQEVKAKSCILLA